MKAFHAHLDACEQCRTQPFNLCGDGERLLLSTADEHADGLLRELRPIPKNRSIRQDAHLGAVEK